MGLRGRVSSHEAGGWNLNCLEHWMPARNTRNRIRPEVLTAICPPMKEGQTSALKVMEKVVKILEEQIRDDCLGSHWMSPKHPWMENHVRGQRGSRKIRFDGTCTSEANAEKVHEQRWDLPWRSRCTIRTSRIFSKGMCTDQSSRGSRNTSNTQERHWHR